MRIDDLHDVLERAAAPVERPDLARAALAGAHRVRVRRRGFAAGGATAVVVAAVVVGSSLTGAPGGREPSPAPSPTETTEPGVRSLGEVTDGLVQDPLEAGAPLERGSLAGVPESLAPEVVDPALADAPAVVVVQTPDGAISYVDRAGEWHASAGLQGGTLFPESLAGDGGAVALRTADALDVYSTFSGQRVSYDVAPRAATGLWANDSVGLFYDVPGPGGETREHEGGRLRDSVAFPLGDDLADVAMDPRSNALHEFTDDTYVVWSNFQDIGIQRDTADLGLLERPVASDGKVAVVRSGAGGDGPAAADGVLVLGADLAPKALLPVTGVGTDEVVLLDFVAASTLLLQVGDRLVTWDHRSGEVREVSTLPEGAVASVAYWNLQ